MDELTFHGARAADEAGHARGIRAMFDVVAPRYDLMNDLMSLGIHRLWKRRLAARAGSGQGRGRALDLAGGTGDVCRLLRARGWDAVVCDPSLGMMAKGRARLGGGGWVAGAGEALPFADGGFALVTVAFGLRNMSNRRRALEEMFRVLAPGGRLLCLEFSRPVPLIAPFYDLYSRRVIPVLGAAVAGRRDAYRYLVESIRAFPDQEALRGLMQEVGFAGTRFENLSFGIAAIHEGTRR